MSLTSAPHRPFQSTPAGTEFKKACPAHDEKKLEHKRKFEIEPLYITVCQKLQGSADNILSQPASPRMITAALLLLLHSLFRLQVQSPKRVCHLCLLRLSIVCV